MSFEIERAEELTTLGRSKLVAGLQFFRHPRSNFHTVGQSSTGATLTQPTPLLSHSPVKSTPTTFINTPVGLGQQKLLSKPLHAGQLIRQLSRFQLRNASSSLSPEEGFNSPAGRELLMLDSPEASDDDSSTINPKSAALSNPMEPVPLETSYSSKAHLWESDTKEGSSATPTLPPVSTMQIVTVNIYMRAGYLWDFWLVHHSTYGQLVLKLVYAPEYPCSDEKLDTYIPKDQIIEEALREEEFYLGPLADLQGHVVPRYYGLYYTPGRRHYYAILLEYAGTPIGPGMVMLDDEWKQKLYTAYETLHLKGVSHGDICGRHILIDDEDQIRLISFRRAGKIQMNDEKAVKRLMYQALQVRTQIGLELPRNTGLSKLPSTYYARVADPEKFKEDIKPKKRKIPQSVLEHNKRVKERGRMWKAADPRYNGSAK